MRKSVYIFTAIFTFSIFDVIAQNSIGIDPENWNMWPDTAASWESDDIYLPGEYQLSDLPVNKPTGGWGRLNESTGTIVTLPATVEQYHWGDFGFRPYKDEYYFGGGDDQVKNGAYYGVSWWWKSIDIPEEMKGKKLLLHIRGARLRAEVYLNGKLVGYNIITETSFECDITKAAVPGEANLLAIRITNPGGRFDWLDTKLMKWGDKKFHKSHGFGGLDAGIKITAHDPLYVSDMYILNNRTPEVITIHADITNTYNDEVKAKINIDVLTNFKNESIKYFSKEVIISANTTKHYAFTITVTGAGLWDLDNPRLYKLTCSVNSQKHGWSDSTTETFGFRWFEADGIGDDAVFRLNGERIRLVSAISWGFWGLNGLFPTSLLADKETLAARSFGMNCIQFHRNVGKTEAMNSHDRLGLLRYMEPGGGQTALGEKYTLYADSPEGEIDITGKNGEAETFEEKYMEEKLLRMIRDHRSHPSLIMYAIQNEINPDLNNPRIFNVIRKMHNEDPSRIVMLKSGIPPINQVWMMPYDDRVYYDSGDGWSGFWDQHTVGGPGIWKDYMYARPDSFTHKGEVKDEISAWGEMLGAAVPDNHALMVKQINEMGGESYDLIDHTEILNAYDNFIDKWGFRKAFPRAADIFTDIGNKCYDFWGRVIETARLSDENDYLVISGWESTAIENHSGLLDNLRNFKGDPKLLGDRLADYRPVPKLRSLVIRTGEPIIADLFLLNETNREHAGNFKYEVLNPDGETIYSKSYELPEYEKDVFVYPVDENVKVPETGAEGFYTVKATVGNKVTEDQVLVLSTRQQIEENTIFGLLVDNPAKTGAAIEKLLPGVTAEKYEPDREYDLLIAGTKLLYGYRSEVDESIDIKNTDDDILYHTESWGYWKNLEYNFTGLPEEEAEITFYFAEVTLSGPGDRIFSVAVNGETLLDEFDIAAYTGQVKAAMDTVIYTNVTDGRIDITIPKLTVNYAKFSALKIEIGDTVIAINAGGDNYTDINGLVWKKYEKKTNLNETIIDEIKEGTPMLLLPVGEEAVLSYANSLADAGAFELTGDVGKTRASWMGSWYFVREHPAYNGLPVNTAMKSYYQTTVSHSDGLLVDGDIDVFAGYGRDHDRNIGAASFTANLGSGTLLFHTLPAMLEALHGNDSGMHPVTAEKIFINSVKYLLDN